ncbi:MULTISPECIES: hypothetical protein [Bacillus]|uniref:Uncharacterized protein n=4 Tax=Bacillaceae TaxID=186817 RepID=U5L7V7_9BACI|nr:MULTISPECIES: hypothetical protein [Bacillus]AGX03515.1 hypothetical protein N288_07925 [Bacillus infantis NRRL B-14911]MCP1157722.1 hypothetical protein [Bacillus infantis]MDT0159725.1 hypothetical protein [Bacillus sp. AG4(2022)]MDW2877616.1 hypothetical protein [Bacillus infantis]RYI32439.1 hypothetical protein EVU96_02245 [Bacillus infantis]
MMAFLQYQLRSVIRSYRFLPPYTVYLVWIFVLYTYEGAPVLSSYAVSSIALYLCTAWLGMLFFSLDQEQEKFILMSHLGSKKKYLAGKAAAVFVSSLPLMIFAIYFPVITGSFRLEMEISFYLLAFYAHIMLAILGLLVSMLFSGGLNADKRYAWLAAVLILTASLAAESAADEWKGASWFLWLLPPVMRALSYLSQGDIAAKLAPLLKDSLIIVAYCLAAAAAGVRLFLKKEA